MDSNTRPLGEKDEIPAYWPLNYALSSKDALAIVSFLTFAAVSMGLGFYAVGAWFGILNNIPINDQVHGSRVWLLLVVTVTAVSTSAIVGKYCWLLAMCRILHRENIGPLIAYGQPRRIGRLDRLLVERLYLSPGPEQRTRLRPPKPISHLLLLHGAAYGAGALLSAAVGFLPLMRGDNSPWQLAALFGALALLHVALARYTEVKSRQGNVQITKHIMTLQDLNALSVEMATMELTRCCGATRWAAEITARRPFGSEEELFAVADSLWPLLTEADWREAFAHHPKIGDRDSLRAKFAATRAWASGEQAGAETASDDVLDALAAGNAAYEARFGYIFIVCATGKSADEMLALLQARLPNLPELELSVAGEEQKKITRLRLQKLLAG